MHRIQLLVLMTVASSTFAVSLLTTDDILESYQMNSSLFPNNKYSIEYDIQDQLPEGAITWLREYNKTQKQIDQSKGLLMPDDYYDVPPAPIIREMSYQKRCLGNKLYFGINKIEAGEKISREKISWDGEKYKMYNAIDKTGVIQPSYDFNLHFDADNFISKIGETEISSILQSGEIYRNESMNINGKNILFVELINYKNTPSEISEIESLKQVTHLWLDPEKALLPTKIESGHILTLKNGKQYDEFPEEVIDNIELTLAENSWVLKSAMRRQYRSNWDWTPGQNEPRRKYHTLFKTWTYNLRNIDTNPTFTNSDFEVTFPDGTLYHDAFLDMGFVQGDMVHGLDKLVLDILDNDTLNQESNLAIFQNKNCIMTSDEPSNQEPKITEQEKAEIVPVAESGSRATTNCIKILLVITGFIICSIFIIYVIKRRDRICSDSN